MSLCAIPYSGRLGHVCDVCATPDEVEAVRRCEECGDEVCAACPCGCAGEEE